jgi:hypothetical protein
LPASETTAPALYAVPEFHAAHDEGGGGVVGGGGGGFVGGGGGGTGVVVQLAVTVQGWPVPVAPLLFAGSLPCVHQLAL